MSVLILLLIASLSVSVIFLLAFIWSTRNRQFEDHYASSMRILFEDHPVSGEEKNETRQSSQADSKYTHSENSPQGTN